MNAVEQGRLSDRRCQDCQHHCRANYASGRLTVDPQTTSVTADSLQRNTWIDDHGPDEVEQYGVTLPIDEPDAVLYSLVKGQHQPVCGTACSRGEVQNADGRCIPSVLLHVKGSHDEHRPTACRTSCTTMVDCVIQFEAY